MLVPGFNNSGDRSSFALVKYFKHPDRSAVQDRFSCKSGTCSGPRLAHKLSGSGYWAFDIQVLLSMQEFGLESKVDEISTQSLSEKYLTDRVEIR